ncbi:hypothetical protein CHS0354_037924 [Potamilus streckersoni]|uniref:Uncharacterized protein n=1 Tax=Potamilus streckersoni TaxID=2493646 RepID=A0AAE0T9F2_9BIVA|nr:hypothetical protein CHS0354_037924 [Potamilus streckersoni]
MEETSRRFMPEVRPPPNRKKDIFDPEKMIKVDERAREVGFYYIHLYEAPGDESWHGEQGILAKGGGSGGTRRVAESNFELRRRL